MVSWNPDADCEGHSARDRVRWMVKNKGLTMEVAQQKVMSWYPKAFAGPRRGTHTGVANVCEATWNPDADCEGHSARDRVQWVVKNKGLTMEVAQQKVMSWFPKAFAGPPADPRRGTHAGAANESGADSSSWNRAGLKDALTGMFCASGREASVSSPPASVGGGADPPDASAALVPASAEVCADPPDASAALVPASAEVCADPSGASSALASCVAGGGADSTLGWNPGAICGGKRAEVRVQWCVSSLQMSHADAMRRVMRDYPAAFAGAPASLRPVVFAKVPEAHPKLLMWSDDFNYAGPPDPSKWDYDTGGHGWGNNEVQHYTNRPENVWVTKGALHIRAVQGRFGGNDYTSARLVTRGKGDWRHVRVEIRMKVPTGLGSFSAAWMLPTESTYGEWPRSGEIDIMQHVGMDSDKVYSGVHTEKYNFLNNTMDGSVLSVNAARFKTYAVEVHPDKIMFMCDGKKYHEFTKDAGASWKAWPFDHPFHIILNVAVGGDWGGQEGIDHDAFKGEGQVMEVAFVRVYRLG